MRGCSWNSTKYTFNDLLYKIFVLIYLAQTLFMQGGKRVRCLFIAHYKVGVTSIFQKLRRYV